MKSSSKRLTFALGLFVLGLVALVLVSAFLTDGPKLLDVLDQLRLGAVATALVCMSVSYLSIALSFSALFQITHHRLNFPKLFSITLISSTFNYVVSTGGLSSLAVRAYLFKQRKIPISVVVPLSVAQSMLTNLVLGLICLSGLLFLRTQPSLQGGLGQALIWGAFGFLVTLVALMATAFFHGPTRRWVTRGLVWVTGWMRTRIFRKPFEAGRAEEIAKNLESSTLLLHHGWGPMGLALLWVSFDWFFTALTLHQCFLAVGVNLGVGFVLVGFTLAFLSSTVNILPGGLGVMEGLMTVTFGAFGVAEEKALVAALLFRVIYFFIPLAVSAALYLDTLQDLLKGKAENA